MLDEQTIVLTNLGSSEEATLLRAKMQSRSLLSDMESFKVKFIFHKSIINVYFRQQIH
jgi:hypothetical protein